MKKLYLSMIISGVINVICFIINLISFRQTGYLKLRLKMYGGEFLGEFGFGLRVSHIYAMREGQSNSVHLAFDPFSLIICFAGVTLIVFILLNIIDKIAIKKA